MQAGANAGAAAATTANAAITLALALITGPITGSFASAATGAAERAALSMSLRTDRGSAAHPFHVSFAEATVNTRDRTLQVALRLWPDDLERAIRGFAGNDRLNIETTPGVDELIAAYLGERFIIRNAAPPDADLTPRLPGHPPVRWVGKEIGIKHAWVYFEVPLPDAAEVDLANSVIFDVTPDQENTVNLRIGERKITAVSTPRDPWKRFRLDAARDTIATLAATLGDRLSPLPLASPLAETPRVIAIEVGHADHELTPASRLIRSIAAASPTLVLIDHRLTGPARLALAGIEARTEPVGDDPLPAVGTASAHLSTPGASVIMLTCSFGDESGIARAAATLSTLDPARFVRAVVRATAPRIGAAESVLADLRGLPLSTRARWAQVAGLLGPEPPGWVILTADQSAQSDRADR